MTFVQKPYRDFNTYLRGLFGCRVQKITVDAGLTCPNRDGKVRYGGCIYCNERGSGTGEGKILSIRQQLEKGKKILGKKYKAKKFLAYFQSFSNTYAPLDRLKAMYAEALDVSDIVGLTIGTRPDCVSEEVLDLISGYKKSHLVWMEYGLQSAHDRTLQKINRGHTVKDFVDAVERTRLRDLPICVHIILGLPGENREDILGTARFLARMDIQAVKIHLLYVIRGTKLHEMYKKREYHCLNRETYIELVCDFLAFLPPHVIIQRLTGDPHREELIAPKWALDKRHNLSSIKEHLKHYEMYQGKFYSEDKVL